MTDHLPTVQAYVQKKKTRNRKSNERRKERKKEWNQKKENGDFDYSDGDEDDPCIITSKSKNPKTIDSVAEMTSSGSDLSNDSDDCDHSDNFNDGEQKEESTKNSQKGTKK